MSEGLGYYAQRIGSMPRRRPWKYDGWPRGENSYAEDNEIKDTEFYAGVNIELQGRSSIRMPRRGSRTFATISGEPTFNGWGLYKNPITDANLMLVMAAGRLYRVSTSGSVTEIDSGETWDDTAKMRGVLLREFFYFGNAVDYMAKTDGTTITRWNAETAPTFNSLTLNGSGSDVAYDYAVTVVTETGETEISTIKSSLGPQALGDTNNFTLNWDRKTGADVQGYNVYRAISSGTMTLLTFIDQQPSGATLEYTDIGAEQQSLIHEAPTFNTTGGVKGNIYAKYANTLFVAGNDDQPDAVFYGGTGDNWESFNPSFNGGWVNPGRGDGEKITAMIGFDDFLLIFKENSIWKFVFGSDGGPTLSAVIPQYGTSSPDTVWRMEKDIAFLGSDGRYRVLGYEPTQLNVIRTTDISNRIQPKLDALSKVNLDNFFGVFFEQKFIVCNREVAFPYDRRYVAFLGKWTNFGYDRFIVWDKGTGKEMLFGAETGTGKIKQLLVDNTYDDDGDSIAASLRVKRIDGGEDTVLKYYYETKTKLKNPRGSLSFITYKDGSSFVDQSNVSFDVGGGVGEYMWDEPMWDEGVSIEQVSEAISVLKKPLEFEAYSIYHQINVAGDQYNHCVVQNMSGTFEVEDIDSERDETII